MQPTLDGYRAPLPRTNKQTPCFFVRTADFTPLASLSTCYLNIDGSCDPHLNAKQAAYRSAWQYPAPPHCNTQRKKLLEQGGEDIIHSDRLAMVVTCAPERLRG